MLHVLSLGAGVQSSTLALMASAGEIGPMPDCAIFSDTQAEPESVYKWLDYLEKNLAFPVHRVTAGSLEENELKIRISKKTGKKSLRNTLPGYLLDKKGRIGMLGRRCTRDFKISPLMKECRRILGKRSVRDQEPIISMWIGISRDEAHRMKPSRFPYVVNKYPLIDKGMSRFDCLEWMREKEFPEPPRSACIFCPFHSDYEWAELLEKEPAAFSRAAKFERELQAAALGTTIMGVPYLHKSCKNLDLIDFSGMRDKKRAQLDLWGNECEGLCGV